MSVDRVASTPDASDPKMPIKVSVVVPVYNPGDFMDRCIDSLREQSLPNDEYEVIFVDDGSTDETPARLDALAAADDRFRVFHIPNSGWPGKPRNIGIAEARGEYVQFVDQDDWMAPEALQRLHGMGRRNESDIVIGKVASNFRGVPQAVFRRNRESCTIHDAPLIDSLTPHKMFRTAFLREHNILFPEGKRRLEDQLFMVRAYFPARTVSILADYVCYFYWRRPDGGNTGSARFDPVGYYDNLREVLDVVVANTEPGEFRNRMLRRFYRVEMLGRLAEPRFPKHDAEYRLALFNAIRDLAAEVMGPEVEADLGAVLRVRSRLLHEDRPDLAVELATRLARFKGRSELTEAEWRGGKLHLRLRAWFGAGSKDGALKLVSRDGRYLLDPSVTEGISAQALDVTGELGSLKVQMLLRNDETGEEWLIGTKSSVELTAEVDGEDSRVRPVVAASGGIDPAAIGGKRPLPRGTWHPMIRLSGLGIDRRERIGVERDPSVEERLRPALIGPGAQPVIPYFDERGTLALDVDRQARSIGEALAGHTLRYAPEDGVPVVVKMPIATGDGAVATDAVLVVTSAQGRREVGARLEPRGQRMWLLAPAPGSDVELPREARLAVRVDGGDAPELPLTRGSAHERFTASWRQRVASPARRAAARTAEAARHQDLARRIYWRAPEGARKVLRSVYRRIVGPGARSR